MMMRESNTIFPDTPANTRTLSEPSSSKKSIQKYLEKHIESTLIRSELNLEQNAVFTVSTRRKKSREITTTVITPNGTIVNKKIIIGKTAGGIETGILKTQHFKVYLVLVELWERAGKPVSDPVQFSTYRIMKRLGMKNSGKGYLLVKRWLRDLRQIPITFINSFYLPLQSKLTNVADLTILSYLDIYEKGTVQDLDQHPRGYGEFRFDDHILQSLINNYTHPLRLDVIKSFKRRKELAILLYTYIDRNLAFKNNYEINLEKLFDHLDLSQKQIRYPSDRKAKIEPVLEQLRGKELSTGVLAHIRVQKTTDGRNYKLVCYKRPFPKRLKNQEIPLESQLPAPTRSGPKPELPESDPELIPLLTSKGLTEKQAAKLILEKEPEVIKAQLEYFLFRLKDYKAQGREINQPGILYDSIKGNWKAPKGHLNAEKEKEREARRLEEERIAQLEQEEQERQEKETAELEAYKESLDPETKAKLREKAQQEIRSMKNIKEGFITEILINITENKILRSEMEDDGLP